MSIGVLAPPTAEAERIMFLGRVRSSAITWALIAVVIHVSFAIDDDRKIRMTASKTLEKRWSREMRTVHTEIENRSQRPTIIRTLQS